MGEVEAGKGSFGVIAVVGVGLIGGSLGLAARKRGLARRVIGIGRNETKLARAKELAAIDDYTLDFADGVADADLVVVCTPVRMIVPTIAQFASNLKPGAIVTDVGSVKAEIVAGADTALPEGVHFVGGHPMAGSEMSGVEAARPDLFEGAAYVFTPSTTTNQDAVQRLVDFADALGARTYVMSPEQHDEGVAAISHTPHVLAAAALELASEMEEARPGEVLSLAAGSFRDLTRVAGSSPELWRDICLSNRQAITATLLKFEEILREMRGVIESEDEAVIESLFARARELRQKT